MMQQQIDPAQLQKLAEDGDVAAQVALGKVWLESESYDEAAKWLHKAADAGDAEAMCLYGNLFSHGHGVDENYEAAAYWLRQSAEQGFVPAQRMLGESFASGQGVPVNHRFASQWYLRAAEGGDAIAALRYGELLRAGNGVDKNLDEAATWLRKAAEAGCADAMVELCETLKEMPNFDAAQFMQWAKRADDAGNAHGTFLLAWGWEMTRDVSEINQAVALYRKAAENGWTDAQMRLGKLYAEGKIVAANQEEAERWLHMAVESGKASSSTDAKSAAENFAAVGAIATINEYPPGAIIENKYFIMSRVGKGGMCTVYKAKHLLMNKMVALKMLLPEACKDDAQVERFRREAQAASSLNHPNIITVHDIGMSPDSKPYMVLEFLEGDSLDARIEAKGALPLLDFLSVFMQITSALDAAHQAGIIHRDIKPSNIMLLNPKNQGDVVKVVDFGLAKIMSGDGADHKLTKTGEVFGTLLYMSPEQCLGHPLDPRTDVYSVGCTMYEAITGLPAFRGNTPYDVMSKHIKDPIPPMASELNVPPKLEQIIAKSLAKDREHRHQSMRELQEDLQQVLLEMM